MFLELARPVTLLGSILSLLIVFHTAFLGSEMDLSRRIFDSLLMLGVAASMSLLSGFTFSEFQGRQSFGEPTEDAHPLKRQNRQDFRYIPGMAPHPNLKLVARNGKPLYAPPHAPGILETLPVQVFFWATAIMTVLFLVSWFLENYVIQYSRMRY